MAKGKPFRRLRMGLSTVLGIRPQGFFIPYRHADAVRPDTVSYAAAGAIFDGARREFENWLTAIENYRQDLLRIGPDEPPEPRWNQNWFPRLDAAMAYVLVRERAPHRIAEVGSGHSTRFMARAIRDGGLATRLRSIDPKPRASLRGLDIELLETTLDQTPSSAFSDLSAGDFLFIDSSHILMPGSDVDILFSQILPALPEGVLIHIHDIFLPAPYPAVWSWRGYNEQSAVAALLQGGAFRPIFASNYAATHMADSIRQTVLAELPLSPDAFESSLWLEKGTGTNRV